MHEELVNMLREHYDEHCPLDRASGVCGATLANNAADAVEELEEKCQALAETLYAYEHLWIPVTERLPDDKEMVIGFTPCDGFMFVGFHVTSVWDGHDYSYWNIVTAMRSTRKMTKKVTHWMPLPKPPKEASK